MTERERGKGSEELFDVLTRTNSNSFKVEFHSSLDRKEI